MIAFRADVAGQGAADIAAVAKAAQHMREVELRPPAERAPRTPVDIDTVDLGEESPAARRIEIRALRIEFAHDTSRIAREPHEITRLERAGGGDDISSGAPTMLRTAKHVNVSALIVNVLFFSSVDRKELKVRIWLFQHRIVGQNKMPLLIKGLAPIRDFVTENHECSRIIAEN